MEKYRQEDLLFQQSDFHTSSSIIKSVIHSFICKHSFLHKISSIRPQSQPDAEAGALDT